MSKDLVRAAKGGSLLSLRVSTGARETSIAGTYGEGAIKLKVSVPPVEGRANAEIERFLARLLGLSRSQVSVVRGASSRDKVVFIKDAHPEKIRESLTSLIQ